MYTTREIQEMPVEELEKVLHHANTVSYPAGEDDYLEDADFTRGINRLSKIKPDSPILQELNGDDTEKGLLNSGITDRLLNEYPMRSVDAVSDEGDFSKLQSFYNRLTSLGDPDQIEIEGSRKDDGYSTRVNYSYGVYQGASTRGRNTVGKDISSQMGLLFPRKIKEIEQFSDLDFRPELLLPFSKLDILRETHPETTFVNARNSVAYLLKDGIPDNEVKYLYPDIFNIVVPKDEVDLAPWTSKRTDKLDFAKDLSLHTVPYVKFKFGDRLSDDLTIEEYAQVIVAYIADHYKDCGLQSDGVVLNVNNEEQYDSLGYQGKFNNGMVALKIGAWLAKGYTARIKRVYLSYGSKYATIMADIEPVTVAEGSTIRHLELKTIPIMQAVKAYPGNVVKFKYSSGMIPDILYPGHGL